MHLHRMVECILITLQFSFMYVCNVACKIHSVISFCNYNVNVFVLYGERRHVSNIGSLLN